MAQLLQAFNARNFDPTQGAGQLPVGNHLLIATASSIKPTKGNDGGYLEYSVRVVEGEHAGSTGAIRFNLYNGSQQAVEIAHRQFSALCHCVGVYDVQDSSQVHEMPFRAQVELQNSEEGRKKGYTQVVKFFDRNGNEPTANGQQGGNQQGGQQSGFGGNNGGQQQGNQGQNNGGGQQNNGGNAGGHQIANGQGFGGGNGNQGGGNQGGNGGGNGGGSWQQNNGGNQGGGNGQGFGNGVQNGGNQGNGGGWGQRQG